MAERGEAVLEEHEAHGSSWLEMLLRAARDVSKIGLSMNNLSKNAAKIGGPGKASLSGSFPDL